MRIDKHTAVLDLTADQRFFVSCWYNQVHQYSLDSHRVRTMNAVSILNELLRLLEVSHANDNDRAIVRAEAAGILQEDWVLPGSPSGEVAKTLVELIKASNGKPKEGDSSKSGDRLILYLAKQLHEEVKDTYAAHALAALNDILLAEPPVGVEEERQSKIANITGALLSTLIDSGYSLESLYQHYRQILVPARSQGPYNFGKKLGFVANILTAQPKKHTLLFAIDDVSNAADFPDELGGIRFSSTVPDWPVPYAQSSKRRLYAEITIESKDLRAAGMEAYTRISSILDLTRFEYERERVHIWEDFLIKENGKADRIRRLAIPKVVPNPFLPLAKAELASFVESVSNLLSERQFSLEGRERVLSAFRLYRQGADTNSLEGKLTNWWTAIEFLVRGLKGSSAIGTSVDQAITPVTCLVYAEKLILDAKQTLRDAGAALIDPATGKLIELKKLNVTDTYRTLTRSDIRPLVSDALNRDPYVQKRTGEILQTLADAKRLDGALAAHEQRIHWQLQRLYRARCDILHSARLMTSGALLCANLEFYLKVTLMSLLAQLRQVQTLGSPEEFFERSRFLYSQLRKDLGRSSTDSLNRILSIASA
jgi:hypothetical protein